MQIWNFLLVVHLQKLMIHGNSLNSTEPPWLRNTTLYSIHILYQNISKQYCCTILYISIQYMYDITCTSFCYMIWLWSPGRTKKQVRFFSRGHVRWRHPERLSLDMCRQNWRQGLKKWREWFSYEKSTWPHGCVFTIFSNGIGAYPTLGPTWVPDVPLSV